MSIRKQFIDLATDKNNSILAVPIKLFLLLLSFVYGACVRIRGVLYDIKILKQMKVTCKVISVGNITWGGTGKTPLVLRLSEKITEKTKIAILTRGYGEDEKYLLKEKLQDAPVFIGSEKTNNALRAQENGAKLLILDDGFQHRKLKRDIDIVTIDALNPFGNKRLIPRGILREPVSSLKRADILVITNADNPNTPLLKGVLGEINPEAEIFESRYEIKNPGEIKAKPICAVCGIGNPKSFLKTLRDAGGNVGLEMLYPDHYNYRARDIKEIVEKCAAGNIDSIVTTEKDMVKLKKYESHIADSGLGLSAITVEPRINNEEALLGRLYSLVNG
ncbi:MAG: tetraacyldisaccharide 4'-kinase [Candidatus Omnitrophota bacterium]